MQTIPTLPATLEEALKRADAWAILAALERCASHDSAFIRAVGGCELEALISDLSLARQERATSADRNANPAAKPHRLREGVR